MNNEQKMDMMEVQTVSSCTLGSHKSLVFGSLYFLLHDHGRHTAGIQKHLFSTLKPRRPKDFQHFAFAKESERRGQKDRRESLQYNKAQGKDDEMTENDGNP